MHHYLFINLFIYLFIYYNPAGKQTLYHSNLIHENNSLTSVWNVFNTFILNVQL